MSTKIECRDVAIFTPTGERVPLSPTTAEETPHPEDAKVKNIALRLFEEEGIFPCILTFLSDRNAANLRETCKAAVIAVSLKNKGYALGIQMEQRGVAYYEGLSLYSSLTGSLFSSPQIREIRINERWSVTAQKVEQLMQRFRRLETFIAYRCVNDMKGISSALLEAPCLRELSLCSEDGDLSMEEEDFSRLGQLHLADLSIVYIDEVSDGLAHLADLEKLKFRNMGKPLKAPQAAHLANFRSLRELVLGSISAEALSSLSKIPHLEVLEMDKVIGENFFPFSEFPELRKIAISQATLTSREFASLTRSPLLEEIDVSSCAFLYTEGEDFPRGLSLHKLTFNDCTFQNGFLEILSHLEHVEILNFLGSGLTDEGLSFLSNLQSLKELELDYTNITGEGLHFLRSLHNLEWVEFPYQIAGMDITSLAEELNQGRISPWRYTMKLDEEDGNFTLCFYPKPCCDPDV